MIQININEAKSKLSKYTRMVKAGETVVLCERNKPFAEIKSLNRMGSAARIFGLSKGMFKVEPKFFAADGEIQKMFEGDPS